MSAFDKVVGYEPIKKELLKICDVIKHIDKYEKLGAKMPKGVLLYGKPGVGKTLMAKCFIEECGLPYYVLRKNKNTSSIVDDITETFKTAKENSPSIVLIDDMDKFANEDELHSNTPEYVAIQAGIDSVSDSKVFTFATVNEMIYLPMSLTRNGRFDQKIEVKTPTDNNLETIISYYLKDKKVSKDINLEDLIKMLYFNSCAELESIINEAAIIAGYENRSEIEMDDLIRAILKTQYEVEDLPSTMSNDDIKKLAMHEAGHLVVSEVLQDKSVGFASIKPSTENLIGGFVHRCKESIDRPIEIMVSLAGKVAVELYYSVACASGCSSDLKKAYTSIKEAILTSGKCGTNLLYFENYQNNRLISETLKQQIESAISSELTRYIYKTRDILTKNRGFLEKIALELEKKQTLIYSEIQQIKSEYQIVPVPIH